MSETVFTQYDPFEPWYTCQIDVKGFYPRPMRWVIVNPSFLSCAKTYVDDSRFSPDLHNDKRNDEQDRRMKYPTA